MTYISSFFKNILSMTLGLKFFLCLNGAFFLFQNTPSTHYGFFICNKCILVRLRLREVVSQRWIQAEIAVHTL